jgi:hypothetical protein
VKLFILKNLYSVPAHGNFEQILNGFYVDKLGYGEYHPKIKTSNLNKFLNRLDKYQNKLNSMKKMDNEGIIKELEYNIEKYSKK